MIVYFLPIIKEVNLSAKPFDEKTFFRIVSSNQETVWGKEVNIMHDISHNYSFIAEG